jgi:hypothetical protein
MLQNTKKYKNTKSSIRHSQSKTMTYHIGPTYSVVHVVSHIGLQVSSTVNTEARANFNQTGNAEKQSRQNTLSFF